MFKPYDESKVFDPATLRRLREAEEEIENGWFYTMIGEDLECNKCKSRFKFGDKSVHKRHCPMKNV